MLAANHHAVVALRRAASVVVCGHVRPDGDAIGSALGLTLALRENGIAAVPTLANSGAAPSTYSWLPGFGLYVPADQLEAADVFVAVDTPVISRLGDAEPLAHAAKTTVCIDHHPDGEAFGTVNVLDHASAATGQMIWRLAQQFDSTPSTEVALCCYVGLVTDTGRFSFDNTTSEALRIAAELIDAGVDPAETARLLYQSRSAASLAIEARALSRLTLVNDGHVAYSWLKDEDFAVLAATPEDAESLPDAVRVLGGIDVALVMRQLGGEVSVNLRSKSGFDVAAVARYFGGGGHHAASGFTFEGTIDQVVEQLLPLLPGGGAA